MKEDRHNGKQADEWSSSSRGLNLTESFRYLGVKGKNCSVDVYSPGFIPLLVQQSGWQAVCILPLRLHDCSTLTEKKRYSGQHIPSDTMLLPCERSRK